MGDTVAPFKFSGDEKKGGMSETMIKKMEMTFKERYQFLEKIFAKKKFKYLKLLSM